MLVLFFTLVLTALVGLFLARYLLGYVLWVLFGLVDVLTLRVFWQENVQKEKEWFSHAFSQHLDLDSNATRKIIEDEMLALVSRLNSELSGGGVRVGIHKDVVYVKVVTSGGKGGGSSTYHFWFDTVALTMASDGSQNGGVIT
jgi:hypothetical protein